MSSHWVNSKIRTTFSLTSDVFLVAAIVLSSFIFASPVKAEESERTLQDGLHLMAISQTILAGEVDEELEYTKLNGAMAPNIRPQRASVEEQLLEAMINSVKSQIATLIKECNETRRVLVERDEECAVSTLDNICEEGKRELRNTLGLLRQVRGDKRKFFTRLGASIKRAGKSIWHAVGPVGRRILRSLGDEVVEAVKTPGGIKVRALRVLVRSRLKSLAKKEIRGAIQRGAERLIMKKWEVARGPTGDQCLEAEVASESQEEDNSECTGDISWIDEYWPEIEATMRDDGKFCMDRGEYRLCLRDKSLEGYCPDDALKACEPIYAAIPPQGPGEVVEIEDQDAFYRDTDNFLSMSFPLDGGKVDGYMEVDFDDSSFDDWYCFVTITFTYSGSYDPETCILGGIGTYTLEYVEGEPGECLGYTGPKEETQNWAMRIRNGRLDTCGEAPGALICEGYDLWTTE
jgi:hypothetical protein